MLLETGNDVFHEASGRTIPSVEISSIQINWIEFYTGLACACTCSWHN